MISGAVPRVANSPSKTLAGVQAALRTDVKGIGGQVLRQYPRLVFVVVKEQGDGGAAVGRGAGKAAKAGHGLDIQRPDAAEVGLQALLAEQGHIIAGGVGHQGKGQRLDPVAEHPEAQFGLEGDRKAVGLRRGVGGQRKAAVGQADGQGRGLAAGGQVKDLMQDGGIGAGDQQDRQPAAAGQFQVEERRADAVAQGPRLARRQGSAGVVPDVILDAARGQRAESPAILGKGHHGADGAV